MLYLFAPPLPEGGGQKYELLRGWGKNDFKPKRKKKEREEKGERESLSKKKKREEKGEKRKKKKEKGKEIRGERKEIGKKSEKRFLAHSGK